MKINNTESLYFFKNFFNFKILVLLLNINVNLKSKNVDTE